MEADPAESYHILRFLYGTSRYVCGMLAGRRFHLLQRLVLQQTFTGYVFRLDELSHYSGMMMVNVIELKHVACIE